MKKLNANLIKNILNNFSYHDLQILDKINNQVFIEVLLKSRQNHKSNLLNMNVNRIKKFKENSQDENLNHIYVILLMEDYIKFEDVVITGHGDGTIRVWNLNSEEPLKIYNEHNSFIEELVYMKNMGPQFFASAEGSVEKKIKIWDLNQNFSIKTLISPYKITTIESLNLVYTNLSEEVANFSLVSGHEDTKIILWDLTNETMTKKLVDFKYAGTVSKIMIISDFNNTINVLYGTYRGVLRMMDLCHKSKITFKGHRNVINSIVRINHNTIASGSFDETIRFWDLSNGHCLHTIDSKSGLYSLLNMQEYLNQNYIICTTGKNVQIIKYYFDQEDLEEPIKTYKISEMVLNYPINRIFYMRRSKKYMFLSFSSQISSFQLWE